MPTYNYQCKGCQFEFEEFTSISSYSREHVCPRCGSKSNLKISGGSGIIFKGNGFYSTDYRQKSKTTE